LRLIGGDHSLADGARADMLFIMKLPQIIETYLSAYNSKDVDALVECVSADVVFENVSNAGQSIKIEGRDAFAELARQAAALFTSRQQTVRTAVVDGDNVAIEVDWLGTPAVDLGAMKAGTEVALRGASFITLSGGKLSRIVDLS
jgi:ketosteroid isomerase-like protein